MTIFYEVKYHRTGSKAIDSVVISNKDTLEENGQEIGTDLNNVFKAFEELAVHWGSYETRYAITNIATTLCN